MKILAVSIGLALMASMTLYPQENENGAAKGKEKGKGRGGAPAVHTLAPGPDLKYSYDIDPLQLPAGMRFADSVAGVAINSKDHIFVYQRSEKGIPMLLEFGPDQKYIRGWGDSIAIRPHGMRIDAQDNIWITDVTGNTVTKMNPKGEVIMTLGTKRKAGTWDEAGCRCLNQPTDIAFAPNGDIFVSQGHGGDDPRVLKFDRNGKLLTQWSGKVEGDGRFREIHTIARSPAGTIYLADRSAKRLVMYDSNGKFVKTVQLANLPCGFYVSKNNEFWMASGQDGQVEKLDLDGNVLGWTGTGPGKGVGQFGEAHYMAINSKGHIYVSDTVNGRIEKLTKIP